MPCAPLTPLRPYKLIGSKARTAYRGQYRRHDYPIFSPLPSECRLVSASCAISRAGWAQQLALTFLIDQRHRER